MCFLPSKLRYYNRVVLASLSRSLGGDNYIRLSLSSSYYKPDSSPGQAVALKQAIALDLSRSIEITRDLRAVALKLAKALNPSHSS